MARRIERSLLESVDLFQGLDDDALGDVARCSTAYRIPKGEAIFCQGDEAGAFFILTEGRLKVTQTTAEGDQVLVRHIGPGEMFGCVAVLGPRRYPGTAEAIVDSEAIGWTARMTADLMERHPRIALNALDTIGGRLQETQDRLREMSTETVERRIAHALLRLVRQAGRPVEDGMLIDFPLSRQDIGELAGATLHTVSRTLSAWEERGLIGGGRQRVIVRDPEALAAIAGEEV